jgi:hypothetical protein
LRIGTTSTRPATRGSEDEILDATLALLDDGDQNAVSVRGCQGGAPAAVYTHFLDMAPVVKALVVSP